MFYLENKWFSTQKSSIFKLLDIKQFLDVAIRLVPSKGWYPTWQYKMSGSFMEYVIIRTKLIIKLLHRRFTFLLLISMIYTIPTYAQNGKFIASYNETSNLEYKELRDTLRYNLFLERAVNDFNSIFNIEDDVYIVLTQGNEINAFYDDNSKMIVLTYELIDYLNTSFKESFSIKEELDNAVSNMTKLILFHEITHCLIDLYQLAEDRWDDDEPTDELMTILLLNIDENYKIKDNLLEALKQFYYASSLVSVNLEELPYWDEHNMSRKRFSQIICWIYGSDNIKYAYFYNNGILAKQITGKCENEFKNIFNKWFIISKKILK